MEKQERIEYCRSLKGKYNCAQAIALGFSDIAGLDRKTLEHCAMAYGTGLGTLDGTCGTLLGAGMVIGLASADRAEARKRIIEVMNAFKSRNSTVTCRALKGLDTGHPLRACPDCVADTAEFLLDVLEKEAIGK